MLSKRRLRVIHWEWLSRALVTLLGRSPRETLTGLVGSDVVVVGTGSGEHEKLVEEVGVVYGGLKSGGSGKEVGSVAEKSAVLGSDVRYVHV